MIVVPMPVLVRQRLVDVLVRVAFGHVKPYAESHEQSADDQSAGQRLGEDGDRARKGQGSNGGEDENTS